MSTTFFEYGSSVVSVNASTDYRLSVVAYPDAVYDPFYLEITCLPGVHLYDPVYLEITVPYDNTSTVFSICRVELVSVGSNLPCVNQTKVNASVTYYSTYVHCCDTIVLSVRPSVCLPVSVFLSV